MKEIKYNRVEKIKCILWNRIIGSVACKQCMYNHGIKYENHNPMYGYVQCDAPDSPLLVSTMVRCLEL